MNFQQHPEFEALMTTIRLYPHADLPRLVLADWLDEHEQPEYAEFIRVQIEIAAQYRGEREPSPENDSLQDALQQRELELWNANSGLWFGNGGDRSLPGYLGWAIRTERGELCIREDKRERYFIRRGDVDRVQASMEWLQGGECTRCSRGTWTIPITVNGRLERGAGNYTVPCGYCKGEGSVPNQLRELVAKWPITRVVVTDKRPINFRQTGENFWYWVRGLGPDTEGDFPDSVFVPDEVFDLLVGYFSKDSRIARFATEKEAVDSLSNALLYEAMGIAK